MDEVDITRTWNVLEGDRGAAYAGHPYMVHWFASRPDNTARAGDYALNLAEFIAAAKAAERQDMNFYVQMNPSIRRDGMRNRAEDVTHWAYHLLDVDPGPDSDPFAALEDFLRYYHHRLGVKLRPHVIFSGRGVQAWLPFWTPVATTRKVQIGEWEGTMGEIVPRVQSYWLHHASDRVGKVYGCTLDPAVADLPRVMRVPGTVNVKSGALAKWIRQGESSTVLADLLVKYADEKQIIPPPAPQFIPGRTWQFYVPLLNWSGHRYLTVGGELGARHDMAVKAAKNLYEVGCDEDQARAALSWGNKLSSPEPLGQEEMDQILRSVYKRTRAVV